MEMLELSLERIVAWHKRYRRKVVDLLQPGRSATALKAPLLLHADVVHLYKWHNGTRVSQEYVLNDLYFTPGYYLLSFDHALDAYDRLVSNACWQESWFPVMTSGGGDYYGVDQSAGDVIDYIRDYPDRPVQYSSLTTMMQSAAECYESDAYFLDDHGLVQVNTAAERIIARRLNPQVDYWQSK
jgi:cell wall assembly regulator SMI1